MRHEQSERISMKRITHRITMFEKERKKNTFWLWSNWNESIIIQHHPIGITFSPIKFECGCMRVCFFLPFFLRFWFGNRMHASTLKWNLSFEFRERWNSIEGWVLCIDTTILQWAKTKFNKMCVAVCVCALATFYHTSIFIFMFVFVAKTSITC